jgi:hypothetical protein
MPSKLAHPLDQSPLYRLRSRDKLARLLRISAAELRGLQTCDTLYDEFDIPKKNGRGIRHVENPRRPLKLVQARMARTLARIDPPDFLFCPVRRRCYVTNAAAHRENRVIQCLDIKSFFPSVTQRRVFWFFRSVMKCESDIAGLIANVACYHGHLPTGSPLSPIMAYFAYYDLWQEIDAFCRARGFTFTVYIDDVTISGQRVSRRELWQVRMMIHRFGLQYHKQKTFIDRPAEVTGVILKDGRLVAPFRQHRKLHEARLALNEAEEEDRDAILGRLTGVKGQIAQIAAKN